MWQATHQESAGSLALLIKTATLFAELMLLKMFVILIRETLPDLLELMTILSPLPRLFQQHPSVWPGTTVMVWDATRPGVPPTGALTRKPLPLALAQVQNRCAHAPRALLPGSKRQQPKIAKLGFDNNFQNLISKSVV